MGCSCCVGCGKCKEVIPVMVCDPCPVCGKPIFAKTEKCPSCGAALTGRPAPSETARVTKA